jgi:MFS transporter, DHA1 family, inner membrane transport protein
VWTTRGFVVFTCAGPLLARITGWGGALVSALLVAYGGATVLGNALGGRWTDRHGAEPTLLGGLLALITALAGLALALQTARPVGIVLIVAALVLWGAGGWMLPAAQMHRLVAVCPTAAAELASLNSSATYLGMALGAALGGLVLEHASLAAVPVTGAVVEVAGLLWLLAGLLLAAQRRRSPSPVLGRRTVSEALRMAGDAPRMAGIER